MENHPLGRSLSRNVAIEIEGRTASNLLIHASSGIKYEYQKSGTSPYDDQETKAPDFHSQDISMDELSADYSLMPPNLTDSEYDSESDAEADTPVGHHPLGSNSPAPIHTTTETSISCGHHPPGKASEPRPTTFTDSEDEPETDVESDDTDDTRGLPDIPSDLIYMISDEEGLGLYTHRSKGNPLDRARTKYYQPSGTYSSKKRIELCGDTCKEYGKDVVKKKELSCSYSVKAFNLNSPAKKTRCSHAETI